MEYVYGKRYEDKVLKYFVKWEGYTFEDSSFEPYKNLGNVNYNIRGFERKMSSLIFKIALQETSKKRLPAFEKTERAYDHHPLKAAGGGAVMGRAFGGGGEVKRVTEPPPPR